MSSLLAGKTRSPPRTVPTCASWNVNSVTMPKLPPPPRMAQNKSAFSFSEAVTISPLASTTWAESRLSIVSPCLRTRYPMPPPVTRPPTPTDRVSPVVKANPSGWATAAISPEVAPPCTRATRVTGSTTTRFMSRDQQQRRCRPRSSGRCCVRHCVRRRGGFAPGQTGQSWPHLRT